MTSPGARAEEPAADQQGDPPPEEAPSRRGTVRLPHPWFAEAVAISSEGKLLVSTVHDGAVSVWDAGTGKELRRFPNKGSGGRLAFAPGGGLLAVSDQEGKVHVLDLATGKERCSWTEEAPERVAFSADGRLILTRNATEDRVRAHDLTTGKIVREWTGNPHVSLSPDGRFVAVTDSTMGVVCVRDTATDAELGRVTNYVPEVAWLLRVGEMDVVARVPFAPVFSPDGQYLACGVGGQGEMGIWDSHTGRERCRLGREYVFTTLAFSPDGRLLAVGTHDRQLRLLRVEGGEEWAHAGPGGRPFSPALPPVFSADGRFVAAGVPGGNVVLWETATGRELASRAHRGKIVRVHLPPDSRTLVTTGLDRNLIAWDLAHLASKAGEPVDDVDALIRDFASPEAIRGWRAAELLASQPAKAVPVLANALTLKDVPGRDRFDSWIKDLAHPKFTVRQSTSQQLEKFGPLARPALEAALKESLDLEARKRVEELLRKMEGPEAHPERLRAIRGVQALEMCGTPEARAALDHLADGPAGAWVTREAALALKRMR